jgi:uncharacterized protein YdeI (YjbR/CyaY-like superfamily)
MTESKSITPLSIIEWRRWLENNHIKESRIILIKYKRHTGKPFLQAHDLMREAICFGWIDTTGNRIDDDTHCIVYVKRNKNSKWSYNTLRYGKELIKEGKMSEFGLKMYKEGLAKKPHDYGIPKNPNMPTDLKIALEKNKRVKESFNKLSPSMKRMYYRMILKAALPETKKKRISEIIKMCKQLHH